MERKHSLIVKFFFFFRWYLVLLALAAHIALAVIFILFLVLGSGRSIEYAKYAGQKVKSYANSQISRKQELIQTKIASLPKLPDAYSFRSLPDARSDKLGYGRVLRVGPGTEFERPSLAAKAARDGDLIEISGGNYPGDSVVWKQNDLLIRSIGGVTKLDAKGTQLAEHKAIWVIRGNNVRIENIEFSNASSRDKNGAGIRAEGNLLQIVSCYFHDNESGVMTNNNVPAQLQIENTEFARNGHPSGYAHQIYVGSIDEFILTGSYIHETNIGSAVKSRARKSVINYNRIVDEGRGRSNYTIDISNGGEVYIIGNTLQQSPFTENFTLISYAPEGIRWENNKIFIVHNTMVNDRKDGNFIKNHSQVKANVINNILLGAGSPIDGPGVMIGNIVDYGKSLFGNFDDSLGGLGESRENKFAKDIGVVERLTYNYHLGRESPAIDTAVDLPPEMGQIIKLLKEYRHPLQTETRKSDNSPDVGAHEYPDVGAHKYVPTNKPTNNNRLYITSDASESIDGLNPILINQKPGTWLKLQNRGELKPDSIHGHAGMVIDPATSKLYFFGSDTHNTYWNNDVWSYDPISMSWAQFYQPDDRSTYQYQEGCRSTKNGRPWPMHTFSSNTWDPIGNRLIVSARPVHYGLENISHVTIPKGASDCWWEFDPAENRWYAVKDGPFPRLGQTTWLPTQKKIIAFIEGNTPIAYFDPKNKEFEKLSFKGKKPKGYTLKTVHDPKRDRVLLISNNDEEEKLWAYSPKDNKWTGITTKNTPQGGLYGSWTLDEGADKLVALLPEDPKNSSSNPGGKSKTWLCDLKTKEWSVLPLETSAPYVGMSYKMSYDPRHKVTLYVVRNEVWSFKAPLEPNVEKR